MILPSAGLTEIKTEKAPKAIGPYSQAVLAGQYLFISGQIAIDPSSGKMVGTSIAEQTIQVLKNIEAILQAQGLTFGSVVKAEVFLKDMNDFSTMNAIYAEKFSHNVKPARQAFQVVKLPLDALVEISCIAFVPSKS